MTVRVVRRAGKGVLHRLQQQVEGCVSHELFSEVERPSWFVGVCKCPVLVYISDYLIGNSSVNDCLCLGIYWSGLVS